MNMRLGIRSRAGWHRRASIALLCVLALASTAAAPATSNGSLRKGTPNDPYFEHQWALQQIRAPQAWKRSTGKGAVVAILDSKVDATHPDLSANLLPGRAFGECPDEPDGCPNGSGPGDYHGTSVAGTAAAVGNNAEGITGTAPQASILPVTVKEPSGKLPEPPVAARAIRWAADNGADVINLSIGYPFSVPDITVISEAIAYALSKDVVVVQAAGNSSVPMCTTTGGLNSPVDPGVLCVVATDVREGRALYSQGPYTLQEDMLAVSAPGGSGVALCGENVLTTFPFGFAHLNPTCGYPDGYEAGFGTSTAAPHVAGVAALLKGMGCNRAQTVSLLTSTARQPLTGERGRWSPIYGYGIVDADAATAAAVRTCRGANE